MKLLAIFCLLVSSNISALTSGHWHDELACPVPNGSGLVSSVLFIPQEDIPQDAHIISVSGTIDVDMGNNERPDFYLSAQDKILLIPFDEYTIDGYFDELPAEQSFRLSAVPINSNDSGFANLCTIEVNWEVVNNVNIVPIIVPLLLL